MKAVSYKVKLISVYVSTTLLGIALTVLAIYNGARDQLLLDNINNLHTVLSDQLTQTGASQLNLDKLPLKLPAHKYRVLELNQLDQGGPDQGGPDKSRLVQQRIAFNACQLKLTTALLEESWLGSKGGYAGEEPCLYTWSIIKPGKQASLLVINFIGSIDPQTVLPVFTQRLLVPLVFFIWITVWGSLMLGNLVNRLQQQRDEVEHMALHDSLTGLPNRKLFSIKLAELISYSGRQKLPFVLAMIDLNKFKNVNDELGHHFGDQLLIQVAERFKECIREYDIVARLGGDEFVLLLPGIDTDFSLQVIERLYHKIVLEYELGEHWVSIGSSIGVSRYPLHDTTAAELIHKADKAMYNAKAAGGGIKLYDESMV